MKQICDLVLLDLITKIYCSLYDYSRPQGAQNMTEKIGQKNNCNKSLAIFHNIVVSTYVFRETLNLIFPTYNTKLDKCVNLIFFLSKSKQF